MALFAALLFLGSSAGTAAVGPLADSGAFGTAFRLALVVAIPLALSAAVARFRYGTRGAAGEEVTPPTPPAIE